MFERHEAQDLPTRFAFSPRHKSGDELLHGALTRSEGVGLRIARVLRLGALADPQRMRCASAGAVHAITIDACTLFLHSSKL